jgi:hypothetical protein
MGHPEQPSNYHRAVQRLHRFLPPAWEIPEFFLSATSFSYQPPLSVDEREDPPLPEFLSDASVRAALHRANALHPQGHLSDEPQFPSALGELPTRHLDVRVRADMNERDFVKDIERESKMR